MAAVVHAHGDVGDVLPAEPGLRLSVQAALRALDAPRALPSTRLDGVLLRGDAGIDPQGTQLEHATLAAAWRLHPDWGVYAAAGAHDEDPVHMESLWVQWRRDADAGHVWLLTAGRQSLSAGPVLTAAGHIGRFALVPLAQRAAFDHGRADDGVQAGWRGTAADADLSVDLGVWRAAAFPGSAHGGQARPGLSAHGGASWGGWSADVAWLEVEPRARAASTSPAVGHSHGSPACDARFTEVICFGGRSRLLGASLRWSGADAPARLPLTLTAAGWLRHERGILESGNGLADYRGRTEGGWLEAEWRWHERGALGLRYERLDARHRIHGAGATILALEARLRQVRPATRGALQLRWDAGPNLSVALESGEENVAGQRVRFSALRLVLAADWSMAGR